MGYGFSGVSRHLSWIEFDTLKSAGINDVDWNARGVR